MKVSISWLKELVDLKVSIEEVIRLLPLRTIGTKEITDDFIELDMKGYNRADLLSLRGVAREVAAITGSQVKFEDVHLPEHDLPETPVKIENPDLASVYCIAKIENLKVEASSDTWVKKLSSSGVRSINNVADVTNLIMLEYGQPMHAFDADKVSDQTLIVRTAKKGEELQTLDGKARKLDPTDLLITDPHKSLGLAGVMGGKDCEISDSTTAILLEAAIFDPVNIRQTAKRHNLPSEASKRFQHGLTKTNLLQALNAAIKMYQELGGKLTALTLVGGLSDQTKVVTLRQEKLNSLIGVDIKAEDVESYLQKLGFTLKNKEGGWEVTVPYWRLDIDIEEDLIEEVARMIGFEKIPSKELEGETPPKVDQGLFELIGSLKRALVEAGLTEVQTYSFYSTQVLQNLDWKKESLIKIANPISSETEYLREDIWPNLVEVAAKNLKQGFEEIAIFEIGKVYGMDKDQPRENYKQSLKSSLREDYRVSLALTGDNPTPELYQIFQKVAEKFKLDIKQGESKKGEYEERYFHPKRFAFLEKDGQVVGGIAEVHPRYTDKFGISSRVAVLEFEIEP